MFAVLSPGGSDVLSCFLPRPAEWVAIPTKHREVMHPGHSQITKRRCWVSDLDLACSKPMLWVSEPSFISGACPEPRGRGLLVPGEAPGTAGRGLGRTEAQ